MKRVIIFLLIMLVLAVSMTGCASRKKNYGDLRALMLLDNTQLDRNKAYFSRHNLKTKKDAYRKYARNVR
jgi:uncharacterized protein YxeA